MQQFFQSVSIALQNIQANPLHTFLSTLGIIIGVASLVAILSLGDGLEEVGREQMESTTSVQMISINSSFYETSNNVRVPKDTVYEFEPSHALAMQDKTGDSGIVELVERGTISASYKDSTLGVFLAGGMHRMHEMVKDSLSGNFFTLDEVLNHDHVAVLSHSLASLWGLNPGDAIGQNITVEGKNFLVKGILMDSDPERPRLFIPVTTYKDLRGNPIYPEMIIKAQKVEDVPIIKEQAQQWIKETFTDGENSFSVVTNEMRVRQLSQGILTFKLVMGAITGISVLVGGIGVMNVLLISVTERTREIGVRKAAGAKKKDIIFQFLSESVTISIVGSILGAIMGYITIFALVRIINSYTDFSFRAAIEPGSAGIIFIIAIFIGIVFGTYPAWRAANLTPVDAIRHE